MTPDYYTKRYGNLKLDPYRIMLIYDITHPAHQQIVKKALRMGTGERSIESDLEGIISAAQRFLEMLGEQKTTRSSQLGYCSCEKPAPSKAALTCRICNLPFKPDAIVKEPPK